MNDTTETGKGYIPPEETTGEITKEIKQARHFEIMDSMVARVLHNFEGSSDELKELEEKTRLALADFVSDFVNIEMENQAKTEGEHLNPMTGVLNRKGAERIFDLLRGEQARKKEGGKMVSVRLDLDNFKKVNDLGDHALGDKVLKEVAENLRHADILIHFSGDEFGLILFDVRQSKKKDVGLLSHDETIKMILSRIVKNIEVSCQKVIDEEVAKKPDLEDLKVSASVGYKILDPEESKDMDFANADSLADDAASFSKKLKGTNLPAEKRIVGADENKKETMERLGVTEADILVSKLEGDINRPIGDVRKQLTSDGQKDLDEAVTKALAEIKKIIEQNFSN
ncbi:GGDEF domain-containing protein [bacterium]|jgi:diguanylate cyclase (GGDEF)-like protein|nr:GGDEF domain-containing protein [bacterium]